MTRQEERDRWDDLTPPTRQELEEASALREALEGNGDHPDAELCRALRIANDPPELDPRVNLWLVSRAVHRAAPSKTKTGAVLFGTSAALALAAGVVLVLTSGVLKTNPTTPAPIAQASLIPSRTTQELFAGPFERHGGASNRIDLIARARGWDYRSNYFERRGVR